MQVKKIKHISFDVWNTLVKPNKKFSTARNQMIADLLDLPVDTVREQYTETKMHLDTLAYRYGLGCNSNQAWHQLIQRLSQFGNATTWNCEVRAKQMWDETNILFWKNLPIVDVNVVDSVRKLRSVGIKMNIASNSNFVPGHAMQLFLQDTFGKQIFDFFIFSDEVGVAKPSFQFFERVKFCTGVLDNETLHVGDDELYDKGSEAVGIRFAHVDQRHTIPWLTDKILNNTY